VADPRDDLFIKLRKNPEETLEESLSLYNLQTMSLQNLGRNKKAVELLEQVVMIRDTTLAQDYPDRLASQNWLGSAYRANGRVKEAVELLEHVVEIRETTLEPDHPDRLSSQHELGSAYGANGQVKEAVELLEQVVVAKQSKEI
jgi:tetratricopeptide (TPR) repeat protein